MSVEHFGDRDQDGPGIRGEIGGDACSVRRRRSGDGGGEGIGTAGCAAAFGGSAARAAPVGTTVPVSASIGATRPIALTSLPKDATVRGVRTVLRFETMDITNGSTMNRLCNRTEGDYSQFPDRQAARTPVVQRRLHRPHRLQRLPRPSDHSGAHAGQPPRAIRGRPGPQLHHRRRFIERYRAKGTPAQRQWLLYANNAGDWLARVVITDPLQCPRRNPGTFLLASPLPMEAGTTHETASVMRFWP